RRRRPYSRLPHIQFVVVLHQTIPIRTMIRRMSCPQSVQHRLRLTLVFDSIRDEPLADRVAIEVVAPDDLHFLYLLSANPPTPTGRPGRQSMGCFISPRNSSSDLSSSASLTISSCTVRTTGKPALSTLIMPSTRMSLDTACVAFSSHVPPCALQM